MMREWKLRFIPLALVAVMAAGCGDNGTDPVGEELPDVAPALNTIESVLPLMDASADAQFAMLDFMSTMMIQDPAVDMPVSGVFYRSPALQRVRDSGMSSLVAPTSFPVAADVPAEMFGRVYIWNPLSGDFGEWQVDGDRAGPENGVRVIWYLTDEQGYSLPLQEQGYIDLTNATIAGLEGTHVEIVRTEGTAAILAAFTMAMGGTDTEATWTQRMELEGYFGDGTEVVDVDLSIIGEGSHDTGDEDYSWDLLFDGPEGTYGWQLDGVENGTTGNVTETYTSTVTNGSSTFVFELEATGIETQTGSGTLSHNGVTFANVGIADDGFTFSRPGGGSFTSQELQELEALSASMMFYGPFFILLFLYFFLL